MKTENMPTPNSLEGIVEEEHSGKRQDQVLAKMFPAYSRSRLQEWIKLGQVSVNGKSLKPREKVFAGDRVLLIATFEEALSDQPENILLDMVCEDRDLLVINKPAGLVVHPGAGNRQGTLLNALLYHAKGLNKVPRAGIVHRLDKDTTGLMVVAKTNLAHKRLVEAMQRREVKREYIALVMGRPTAGGTVDAPIGRHLSQRTKMAVVANGKPAITHYKIEERFANHTLLQIKLETGRTHQIRVHMEHIGFPIVGDPVYSARRRFPKGATERLRDALKIFRRQALHAFRLGLVHPVTGEELQWQVPLPKDFEAILAVLRDEK